MTTGPDEAVQASGSEALHHYIGPRGEVSDPPPAAFGLDVAGGALLVGSVVEKQAAALDVRFFGERACLTQRMPGAGRSTRITEAPRSASSLVQYAPPMESLRSSTFTPFRAVWPPMR